MGFRGTLVYLPAYPFEAGILCPDRELALGAALLHGEGYDCNILDYGTLNTYARFFSQDVRDTLLDCAETFFRRRAHRAVERRALQRIREREEIVSRQAAFEAVAHGRPDFLLLKVSSAQELSNATAFAQQLRQLSPSTVIAGFGAFFAEPAEVRTQTPAAFDCIFTCPLSWALREWVTRVHDRRRDGMPPVPSSRVTSTAPFFSAADRALSATADRALSATACLPCYAADTYPAIREKIQAFEAGPRSVQDCKGLGLSLALLAERCVDEITFVHEQHGARGFHLMGDSALPGLSRALVYKLLSAGPQIRYALDAGPATFGHAALQAAEASGCRVLSFQIDSGSQRLIEDFYGHGFGVSQAEVLLRATRRAKIFTTARFRYPCPADDCHTRAETVRLIDLARPHSVDVEFEGDPRSPVYAALCLKHDDFRRELDELGVAADVSPKLALAANLAGFAGNEADFFLELGFQFFAGDIEGLAASVDRINAGAGLVDEDLAAGAYPGLPNAVGN